MLSPAQTLNKEPDLDLTQQPALSNSQITSKPNESECPDLLCSRVQVEQGSCCRSSMHAPAAPLRPLTEARAPSSVCCLPSPYITASGGGRWGGVQD